jgi:hypothetical protein
MTKFWRTDVRLILLTLLIGTLVGAAAADPPVKPSRGAKPSAKSGDSDKRASQRAAAAKKRADFEKIPVTPEREELALNFARKHHPELADLLSGLKAADRTHYENAVREVARDAERLGKLTLRDRERSQVSLRIWKFDSRIRLEAARFSMDQSDETEKELRKLMSARQKARLAWLKLERERATTRVKRIGEQIDTLARNPEERITAEIDRLRRTLAAKGRSRGQSASPRSKNPATAKSTVRNASKIRVQPARKEAPVKGTRSKNTP